MAEHHIQYLSGYHIARHGRYNADDIDHPTHVAWPLDDLPELAADIHLTVAKLLVSGNSHLIDAAIIDRLRGTTPRATDGVAEPAGHG